MENTTHYLKTWEEYFVLVKLGIKNFELRLNDRNFKNGDTLVLQEFNPETLEFTGESLWKNIDYVMEGGKFGLEKGYVILSISDIV